MKNDPFMAIADPTRRAILRLLQGGEHPAGRIAAAFAQQRPAISKHLAILRRAGLISETRDRQQRLYGIRPGAFEAIRIFLAEVQPTETGLLRQASATRMTVLPPARREPREVEVDAPLPTPTYAAFSMEID